MQRKKLLLIGASLLGYFAYSKNKGNEPVILPGNPNSILPSPSPNTDSFSPVQNPTTEPVQGPVTNPTVNTPPVQTPVKVNQPDAVDAVVTNPNPSGADLPKLIGVRAQLEGPPINEGAPTPDRLKLGLYNQSGIDFRLDQNRLFVNKITIFTKDGQYLGEKAISFSGFTLLDNSFRTLGIFKAKPELENVRQMFINGATKDDFKVQLLVKLEGQDLIVQ